MLPICGNPPARRASPFIKGGLRGICPAKCNAHQYAISSLVRANLVFAVPAGTHKDCPYEKTRAVTVVLRPKNVETAPLEF